MEALLPAGKPPRPHFRAALTVHQSAKFHDRMMINKLEDLLDPEEELDEEE